MRTDSEQQTAWTPGPLAAFGEHKSEHGKFVYAVRETHPKGQIAGYPTPTARYRSRADAQLGALAPEMAAAVIEMAKPQEHVIEGYIVHITAPECVIDLADQLRKIGATS